eukprot:scaffold867_cov176-Ochromonas_danica.AAC.12
MDNRYPREEDWKQEESLWQGMVSGQVEDHWLACQLHAHSLPLTHSSQSTESTLTRAVNRLKQAVLEDDVTVSCDIPALMHTIAQVLPADPSKTIESLLDDLFWLKWKDKIALDVVFGLREWKDLMAADHLLCYKIGSFEALSRRNRPGLASIQSLHGYCGRLVEDQQDIVRGGSTSSAILFGGWRSYRGSHDLA